MHPELLLLFAFTINRKKNQEKRVWEKQKMGKVSAVWENVLHCKQNHREIQHSLRTQQEGGTWRHPFFTEWEAKLITVSFNSRYKEYFKAQQDTLDTTYGALQDSCTDETIKSEDSEPQNKTKPKPNQNKHTQHLIKLSKWNVCWGIAGKHGK